MIQTVYLRGPGPASTSVSQWLSLTIQNSAYNNADQAKSSCIMPAAGTISNLRVRTGQAPGTGGSGKSWTFTLYKNASASAVTCTISETATYAEDLSNSFTVAQDDEVGVQFTPANTPGSHLDTELCFDFEPDDGVSTIYMQYDHITFGGSGVTFFFPTCYNPNSQGNDANEATLVLPIDCTVDVFSVKTNANMTATTGLTYHLYKNGVKQDGTGGTTDTGVVATGTQRKWKRTSVGLACVAGDRLHIQAVTASGGAGGGTKAWSHAIAIIPTTAGECFIGSCQAGTVTNSSATRYLPILGASPSPQTSDSVLNARNQAVLDLSLRKFHVWHSSAPGGSASRTHTIRVDSVDSTVTLTISGSSQQGADTTHTVDVAQHSFFQVKSVNSATAPATATDTSWTAVYSEPAASPEPSPQPSPGGSPPGSPSDDDERPSILGTVEMCFGGSYRLKVKAI